MPWQGVDRILEHGADKELTGQKDIRSNEPFFRDHFPDFAVLPGVLMLEGMTQAASWLVRKRENFRRSQVYMEACSQVRYSRLVRPDTRILYRVVLTQEEGDRYFIKGRVLENEKTVAAASFVLRSSSLEVENRRFAHLEVPLNERFKDEYRHLADQVPFGPKEKG